MKDRPYRDTPARRNKLLLLAAGIALGTLMVLLITFVAVRRIFNLTSSSTVLYLLRQPNGATELTTYLRHDEQDKVVRRIDFSSLLNRFARTEAAIGMGKVEFTWNAKEGDGVIKEFRKDGTEFLVVLARFSDDGTARGVFIGGNLPLGNTERVSEAANNNAGIAYYDGKRWNHIWCSLNEGVSITGASKSSLAPGSWKYLGSTVLKATAGEARSRACMKRKTGPAALPLRSR